MMIALNHIALECADRDKARLFYSTILNLPLERSFTIDEALAERIFQKAAEVEVDVFRSDALAFEIFYPVHRTPQPRYVHTCIEVANKEELLRRCEENGKEPMLIADPNRDRTLLFLTDFSGNLFEVKRAR